MLISVAANGLNIILNSLLIYAAGLGVAGAAIASAISYTLSGILMFVFFRKKAQFSWKWKSFSVEKGLLKECFTVGAPVLGTSLVSCFGYVVFASLVSGMEPPSLRHTPLPSPPRPSFMSLAMACAPPPPPSSATPGGSGTCAS